MTARLLCLILLFASASGAQSNGSKQVLLLMEEDGSWPIYRMINENIRATLRGGYPGIVIFSEHLDHAHFPDPALRAEQNAWIAKKYAHSNLDLVIGVGDVPTDLFPNAARVSVSADAWHEKRIAASGPSTVNVWVTIDAEQSLEVAQVFQPHARRIVVIGDGVPTEDMILTRLQKKYPTSSGGVPITYVTNPGIPEICQQLSQLGADTIVIFTALTRDDQGHPLIPAEVLPKIVAASGAPVYVLSDTFVGSGAVGGKVASFAELGKTAGQLGLRMLAGEHPRDVAAQSINLFDWRQLRRWKIPESALPAGSVVLYRQPSLWASHKEYVIGGIVLFLVETLLIAGLLWQGAIRKRAQESLLEQTEFEKMLSELSATFIAMPEDQVGASIERNLGRIAEFLKLDRITLFGYSQESGELRSTFSWRGKDVEAPPAVIGADRVPWSRDLLLRGESLILSDVNALPEEANGEREYLRRVGAVSVAMIPLQAGGEFFGCMSLVSTKRRVEWSEKAVKQLKLLAEIFSNALMRRRALDAQIRHAAIVESSDDAIVSKSLDGIIESWNAAAERLFGFSEAEVIGKPITIIIPEELGDEETSFLERLRAGESVTHYETVRLTKGGEKVAVSLTISPVRDSAGKITGFSKIARDITDRKRAEQVLRESEERFRLVANTAPVLIWMSGTDKLCNFFNQGWLKFTGRRVEEEVGKGWAERVHPEDIDRCLAIYSASFDARVDFEMEYRLRRFDGEYRWMVDYGVPRFEADGNFCGYIGSCVDITERKSSAESLQALSGRLINAQEEERARIARELHDDFSQRLALQCIDIEQLRNKLPPSEVEERERLLKMLKGTKAMSADIRSLSHQLHSSKLELVGLVPAVKGLCEEIGAKYKIEVQFLDRVSPVEISKEAALCLFRVAQEALGNVVKHSQAKSAQVELTGNTNRVRLRISDEGRGFDAGRPRSSAGLGLIGMTERLRLVGGLISIRSEPQRGTEILAEVPLIVLENEPEQARVRAARGITS